MSELNIVRVLLYDLEIPVWADKYNTQITVFFHVVSVQRILSQDLELTWLWQTCLLVIVFKIIFNSLLKLVFHLTLFSDY